MGEERWENMKANWTQGHQDRERGKREEEKNRQFKIISLFMCVIYQQLSLDLL